MHKPAETHFQVHPLIRDRWSPVCFSSRKIESEILGSLFEAARWAPSSYNEQPWSFCIATQDQSAEFAAILSCLMEANQVWAKNAYALVISVAKLAFDRNGKPNRHAFHDVGLATQNLFLEALSHGIFCHPMAGFDVDKARSILSIPPTHEAATAIAIGYPADDLSKFDAGLQQRDRSVRSRKPMSQVVFTGKFGMADRRF
jgi:nitroreductase